MTQPPLDRDYITLGTMWALGFILGAVAGIALTLTYLLAGAH